MSPSSEPPPSRRKDRSCGGCGTPIRRDNKSGYCARCVKRQPGVRAAISAGAKARYADPAERARTGEGVRRANQLDPTIRERKRQAMRELAATPEWQERNRRNATERRLWEKGVAGRTPESDAKQGVTFSRRHGIASWCPEDYVKLARELRRKGIPLDEVKDMIAKHSIHDLVRWRKRMGFD